MPMRHVDAYSCRAPDNVELLVCPSCRVDLARSVLSALRGRGHTINGRS